MIIKQPRFGVFPWLTSGVALSAFGVWLLVNLMNNVWLVPIEHPGFFNFQRDVMRGTVDPAQLLRAGDVSMIGLFLLLVLLIGFGMSLPLLYYANRSVRMRRNIQAAAPLVLLRQGVWFGLWLALLVLLQMARTFSFPVALLLAAIFALLEAFIIVRQRTVPPTRRK